MRVSNRTIIGGLMFLLLLALIVIAMLYPIATRPLVRPADAMLVEKARKDARAILHDDVTTFPIVMRLSDRECVELRSPQADGAGSYLACYDTHTNQKVEERLNIGF